MTPAGRRARSGGRRVPSFLDRRFGPGGAPLWAAALAVALAGALALPIAAGMVTSSAGDSLPYATAIGRCYDAVLDARFDAAETEIAQACGPAPPPSCELMRATSLWWRLQLDPHDRSLDPAFEQRVDGAIGAIDRWTAREPRRADAWFFLGAAYGLRVQFRVLRRERLAAARDGKRIKDALERSLAIDPGLQDAYFGIGLYHYYADVAPAALKLLRWLLLLPGGDRAQGLREMVRARDRGELIRGEADFQLHLIYLWYEQNAEQALTLLEGLRARYPHNPLFVQSAAEVQDVYLHDHAASLETWQRLLDLARQRQVAAPEISEVRARLGAAAQLDALFETDQAIEQLRLVLDRRPSAPHGAMARARLRLGLAYDRLGMRSAALSAYRAALTEAPRDDPEDVRRLAHDGIGRTPDARAAEAYRLSIEGWRRLQQGALQQAGDSLNRSSALNPGDAVTRYRQAVLLQARGRTADALVEFERLAADRPTPPPTILGASFFEAGRLLEAAGDRTRALEMYDRATRVRGARADTRRAADQSRARLRATRSPR